VAKFPGNTSIRYTNASPSGQSAGVTANINTNQGSEAIGAGAERLGGAVFDIGMKIQKAQDSAELSTLDRKSKEIWNAASQTIQTTQDPDARKKIYDKAVFDMGALKSKRQVVNDAYKQSLDDFIPRAQVHFNGIDRTMKIYQAKDEILFNGQKALEIGDVKNYQKLAVTGLNTGLLTQAEYDHLVSNAPINSQLAQARIALDTDPNKAIASLEDLKGLSGEQLDQRDKLLHLAYKSQEAASDQFQKDILSKLIKADESTLTPSQRSEFVLELRKSISAPGNPLTGEQARVVTNYVQEWEDGKFKKGDMFAISDFENRASRIWMGNEDPDQYDKDLRDALLKGDLGSGKEGHSEYLRLNKLKIDKVVEYQQKSFGEALDYGKGQLVVKAENEMNLLLQGVLTGKPPTKEERDSAEQRVQLSRELLTQYNREMYEWLRKNPNATDTQIYQEQKSRIVKYRDNLNNLTPKVYEAGLSQAGINQRVKVKSPTGQIGSIPADKLEEAIQQGYTRL